jgi:hypothetical protein
MKLGTHDVVVVAGQHANACTRLPVPNTKRRRESYKLPHQKSTAVLPNSLVIRGTQDPWIFVMERGGSHVVQMAIQCENATFLLIVPDFDFEIVTTADEKRLLIVKRDSSDWAIVLVKLL